ncbi:hypothetical protein [Piscibacillus halophilus]|uniref:Transmembrane transcriptional regulator (Anti-sigma factor RsiW) n=1 Tax=Piscibacillus halophilus TaxID=571933 RepID=A0A1H9FA85_9BACI|nr:hypothetical protein [Piscibacillus halophilus]SEQ34809.1 hypothetical protein SAMN05216362_11179 [Piscibacillus halophilus]
MACNQIFEEELHRLLNSELTHDEENCLKHHLMECKECQTHYQELKKVDHQLLEIEDVQIPNDLKQNILNQLPKDSKTKKFSKSVKEHPLISAAVVFFIMLFASTLSSFHSNQQMSLSKHEDVITEGDRVIIPKSAIIEGDFIVRNAEVVLEGKVKGNLTLVNSQIVDSHNHHDMQVASWSHHVDGKVVEIDQYFAWMYHKVEHEFKNFLSFVTP